MSYELNTFSIFYYGQTVGANNQKLPIDEGSGEIVVNVDIGDYTLETLRIAVQNALNNQLTNSYIVSVDRSTRIFTITCDQNFEILGDSGAGIGLDILALLGFDYVDSGQALAHSGINGSGEVWEPQMKLQNWKAPERNRELIDPTVNEAASGTIEVVRFGFRRFAEFEMKYINNYGEAVTNIIKADVNALDNATNFFEFATTKAPFELMRDISDRDIFDKYILESTQQDGKGTKYELTEQTDEKAVGYYKTGKVRMRLL